MAKSSVNMRAALAPWGRRSVVYQVYPKSFRDSSGDGVGDLKGITEKLRHVADLGADVCWLSPIFASPMADNGYDVSDYTSVNPLFGTLDDVDALIAEGRRLNVRIVLDIALNHTSVAHPWFQAALGDPSSPMRDYYWLRPGRAPNNWRSIFGGPAWGQFGETDLSYLHLFDRSQPDLNWENPAVRAEIHGAMRFWLERGIGGFRLDVVTVISKDPALPDAADTRLGPFYRMLADGPRLKDYLREMRREVFSQFDCIAIGEAPGVDPARAAGLVDPRDPMLDMIYHFDLVEPKRDADGDWDRVAFKAVFSAWDAGIGPDGWNTTVLGNHDLKRLVSRFGDDGALRVESAKMLAALSLTQRATPFIYQGDELGMTNCRFPSLEALDDVWAKTTYRLRLAEGASEAEAFAAALAQTRDDARTPFPWTDKSDGGFTEGGAPWLMINPNVAQVNAAAQVEDPTSVMAFVKALIALRGSDPLWVEGRFEDLAPKDPDVFVYERRLDGRNGVVVLNLRGRPVRGPQVDGLGAVLSNYAGPFEAMLRPWEARIYTL
ncbi:MAG: glycoside hydrolase family 13 protein [Caulobacterales bacterium]|jgi:oligo-1,6-glucosidase